MKLVKLIISCLAIVLAGCTTIAPKSGPKYGSLDDPSPFDVWNYGQGSEQAFSSFSAAFYVKQGVPFRYSVEGKGAAVKITVVGGLFEKKIIDQKSGLNFESTFTTDYTGLADFVVEVADQGRASGRVIPVTKIDGR